MFRYKSEAFGGMPRSRFIQALHAEGIPCSPGYSPLNKEPFLQTALDSKGYRRIYSKEVLDRWKERTQCPANEQLCHEAIWLTQTMFLGPRGDMDQIAAAVRKIKAHTGALAKV
jgi:perosamine synthetase